MPSDPERIRADAVVIGTGAGGAAAGAVLAEAGFEVVLLEAGPRLSSRDFTGRESDMLPRLMMARVSPPSGMEIYAGACVGGSTVVNDALCWRTPEEVLDAWRDQHQLDWDREGFGRALDRVWRDVHATPTGRDHLNRNAHHLEVGAARLGWAAEAMPRNVRGCANLGLCNLGCPTNAKQSTLLTYVPRAERAGARILAGVRAERVRWGAGGALGVSARRVDASTRTPQAALEVDAAIVCVAAGVLESGALLLRSGLSERAPATGRQLQFHSSVYVTARFREPVHAYYGPTMAYAVTEFADVNRHTGPGFMLENVSIGHATAAAGLPGFGADHERAMHALPHLARTVVVLRDHTRGHVELSDAGPPVVSYDPTEGDLERLRAGVRASARAYLAAGAVEVFSPVNGLPPIRSEADLAQLDAARFDARGLSLLYAVHLFGGAVMGGTRADSVCDPIGQVWDTPGLYVCDASSLPTNTGVNPQVTIMANALRIADAIAAAGPRS